jgi:Tfp pilus assembly protein PilX
MSLRDRVSDDRGWALLTAILLMTIMLGTVLSVASFIDGQTREGAATRQRETAFNLTEAALNAQIFALSQDWPGTGSTTSPPSPYPVCTQASSGARCPNASALSSLIASPDAAGATWQTVIRDDGVNASPNFYSDATTLLQPGYDKNGDGKVWIRATATARGKTRTMVTLVRVEEQSEDIPHAAVIANRLYNSNNGSKPIVDMSHSTGANGFVGVRCTPQLGESNTDPCLAQPYKSGTWPTPLVQTQLAPYDGHIQLNYNAAPAVTAAARARLKARAVADGTYFATCPATIPSREVVWVESGNCQVQGTQVNAPTAPGMLIVNSGTVEVLANADFYGVIYAVNSQNSSGTVITVHANGVVHGGVIIDGPGGMEVGSNKANVIFDDTAYNAVKTYGTAGMIQNTWREIKN